jgi:transposase
MFSRTTAGVHPNLQVTLIGMESCSGSHILGRALREQGHEVRLMPAQYVKPYVQTNKSDFLNAESIADAVQRPRVRFVPIEPEESSTPGHDEYPAPKDDAANN